MTQTLLILMVILAALAGLVAWRARHREARAEAEHPPRGQIVDVDGVKIHAEVMGSGPDLVLIHGSSGNTRDMSFALAPRLAARYRVILFDRPGLGHSDRGDAPSASIERQAELLMRAARALGADRPVVLGHSYGGAVALAWAVKHPDAIAALVLVAAASNPWEAPLEPYYRLTSSRWGAALAVPLITAFAPGGVVRRAIAATFAPQQPPEGYVEHTGAGLTLRRATTRENALQRADLLDQITALHHRYGEIAVPVEIVHGTADDIVWASVHAEPLARQIDGAVLTLLDGIGHMPHHVATEAVIAAIKRATTRAGLR